MRVSGGGSTPKSLPYPGGQRPHLTQCVIWTPQPAKWHLNQAWAGCASMTDDRQTDHAMEKCRNRRNCLLYKSDSAEICTTLYNMYNVYRIAGKWELTEQPTVYDGETGTLTMQKIEVELRCKALQLLINITTSSFTVPATQLCSQPQINIFIQSINPGFQSGLK